ncbi:hypothetical protein GGR58DRAFT_529580 [Xylaria digitata]|nr:hypothetical protein GGR58DRAFT_529580 [Xylaria digitata]
MEAFEFGKACVAITTRLSEKKMIPDSVWKRYLPRAIKMEIDKAESLYPTLGLRSPVIVQQCICKNLWDIIFKQDPVPWVVNDTVSFGVGEEMEIDLMNVALKVSLRDVKAALRILAKNSTDGETTTSQESGSNVKAGAESTNLVTPATPKAQSLPKPNTEPNQVPIPAPIPASAPTPTLKPTPEPAPVSTTTDDPQKDARQAPSGRRAKCLFGSWKDESGKALPAFPGAAPGEIVLPDNMDPMRYLLPIQADMEAWLNMRFYFEPKTQTSPNKIKIKPTKVRNRDRPAEVDMRYGLIAFNVLLRWTNAMIEQGKMIPVIEFIHHDLGCDSDLQAERTVTRMLLEPRIGKTTFPGPIEAITPGEMKRGSSKYHSSSTPNAAASTSKPSPIHVNLNLPKRPPINQSQIPNQEPTTNVAEVDRLIGPLRIMKVVIKSELTGQSSIIHQATELHAEVFNVEETRKSHIEAIGKIATSVHPIAVMILARLDFDTVTEIPLARIRLEPVRKPAILEIVAIEALMTFGVPSVLLGTSAHPSKGLIKT